jgi:hypothetical protein
MELLTAKELRNLLDLNLHFLRFEFNLNAVRTRAQLIAAKFADDEVTAKSMLPAIDLRKTGNPNTRDANFNRAVDDFISACESVIASRGEYDKRVHANSILTLETTTQMVMAVMGELRAKTDWVSDVYIVSDLALSVKQVTEAFEELAHFGLVEYRPNNSIDGKYGASIKLTARGRMAIEGRLVKEEPASVQITHNNQQYHGPVAFGDHNTVTQHNVTLPPLPPDVRRALIANPDYAGDVVEYEHATKSGTPPKRNILQKLAGGVKFAIETGTFATDVIDNGNAWVSATMHALSSIPF